MDKIKKLLKYTIIYGILNGIEALVPFLFLIILSRFLTTEEYGVWSLFAGLYAVVIPLIGGKLDDAVRMHFNELTNNNLNRFISTALYLITFLSLLLLFIVTNFSSFFSSITKFPERWLWTIIMVAFLYAVSNILRSIYQFKERSGQLATMVVIRVAITLAVTSAFVIAGARYTAAIFGTATGLAGSILISTILFRIYLDINVFSKLDRKFLFLLLRFFIIYLPTAMGAVLIPLTDRLFIAHIEGLSETSFYSIANHFGAIIGLLVSGSFLFAWLPWIFNLLRKNDKESIKTAHIATLLFYIGLPLIGLIIWQVSIFIAPYLMSENFLKASDYIFWLIIAAVIQGYFTYNQGFLHFAKKTNIMSLCSAVAIISNIIFDYIFIIKYGTVGIAYATIVAYGCAAIVSGIMAAYFIRSHIATTCVNQEHKSYHD
ncbi:MAG: oligosaccharide flippase family protein [Rickettsiales bacterium]